MIWTMGRVTDWGMGLLRHLVGGIFLVNTLLLIRFGLVSISLKSFFSDVVLGSDSDYISILVVNSCCGAHSSVHVGVRAVSSMAVLAFVRIRLLNFLLRGLYTEVRYH